MRVLWVSHTGSLGGAELALAEGVRALEARGVESLVVAPAEGPLAGRLGTARLVVVPTIRFWMRESRGPLLLARSLARHAQAARAVAREIERSGADVVVTNTLASPVGAFGAALAWRPHVWFIHEFGWRDQGLLFDLGETVSLALVRRLSARIAVNSRALFEAFGPRLGADRLRVVHQSVEVDGAAPADDGSGPLRAVIVASKLPAKRQEEAIEALAILRRRGVSARLRLVGGEGHAYAARLRERVRELGLEADVEFSPFSERPAEHFAWADVAINCGASEAFGRATVEAMKAGRAVVGAAAAGTAELIEHGKNGLLYRPGHPEDLAEKLEALHRDRGLARELGRLARDWASAEFHPGRYADELLGVLQEAVG